jgi:hypothetical protein
MLNFLSHECKNSQTTDDEHLSKKFIKREDKALPPHETGRVPKWVASEVTWSNIFIHLPQSIA